MTHQTLRHGGLVGNPPTGMQLIGPIIAVSISAMGAQGAPAAGARRLPARLMIDTGAQLTVINDDVLQNLGINPVRFIKVTGVSQQPEDRPVYFVNIHLGMSDSAGRVHEMTFSSQVVGGSPPVTPQQHVGLLGRDFLQHARLIYDGPKGTFLIEANVAASAPPIHSPVAPPHGTGRTPPAKRKQTRKQQAKSRKQNRPK